MVMTLDLHANITRAMVERATAIVGYQTFPHLDMYETGQKAARLMLKILTGKVRPAMAWRKLPLIVNAENQQTSRGPAHRLMARAQAYEQKRKAEAVSIFFVQPWLDIEEMGAAVVVGGQPPAPVKGSELRHPSRKNYGTPGENLNSSSLRLKTPSVSRRPPRAGPWCFRNRRTARARGPRGQHRGFEASVEFAPVRSGRDFPGGPGGGSEAERGRSGQHGDNRDRRKARPAAFRARHGHRAGAPHL